MLTYFLVPRGPCQYNLGSVERFNIHHSRTNINSSTHEFTLREARFSLKGPVTAIINYKDIHLEMKYIRTHPNIMDKTVQLEMVTFRSGLVYPLYYVEYNCTTSQGEYLYIE